MTDICKRCGRDNDCPICQFGGKGGDILLETINKKSVTVMSGPATDFKDRYRAVISGDSHDMEALHNFLLTK